MVKKSLLIFLTVLLISGCAPSETVIQTAIAATANSGQVSKGTEILSTATRTPRPTRTITAIAISKPSITPKTTEIPTATNTNEDFDEFFREGFVAILETLLEDDIEMVNLARIRDNVFEIEVKTRWAAKDNQPDVSYKIIQYAAIYISAIITNDDETWKRRFPNGMVLDLLTYSTDAKYPYQSTTDLTTLLEIEKKSISYQEWIEAANAGFK